MKEKKWNIPEAIVPPEALLRAGYTPLLAAVLAARGIAAAPEASAFLSGGGEGTDPMAMADMAAAVARIRLAKERDERVAVYGDYDVDGITATCLLTDCLLSAGLRTERYIPDRLEEGYGVNTGAIDRLHSRGVSLIITVDCGITAVAETAYAAGLGVDMIITDHHECQAQLPAAAAVVDPKRPDCSGADRDLAGVGVAFKLACALSGDSAGMLERYADLVAVGTVADVMPLLGENRRIVQLGLAKLRSSPRPGLAALMELTGVTASRLGANNLGFTLAPRINAAGRLGQVDRAAALILERNPRRAEELAEELCEMNRRRQQLEADIWDEAVRMLSGRTVTGPIVLAREGWHQGVIGIVASRLSEAYRTPAVMISLDGDRGKGSCRSWGGFNLFDALAACGEHLESFGGHALAAGLNLRRESIGPFRQALQDYYAAHLPDGEEALSPDLTVTDPDLLSMECVESLEVLEPFGSGNPRPLVCLTDARLRDAAPIGGGKHTRLTLERFGQRFECVWFGRRAAELGANPGELVDAVFYPQVSEFRSRRSVQLVIEDMRRAGQERLCRHILEGGDLGGCRLTRPEISGLWLTLRRRCPIRCRLTHLADVEPRLRPAQIALGLRVLKELGLADARLDGREIAIALNDWDTKTELDRSPTWREQLKEEERTHDRIFTGQGI